MDAQPNSRLPQPAPIPDGVGLLTHIESAAYLRLAPRTLARHRSDGTGPVFIRLGRRILYHPDDLRAWAQAHRYRSTSEPSVTSSCEIRRPMRRA